MCFIIGLNWIKSSTAIYYICDPGILQTYHLPRYPETSGCGLSLWRWNPMPSWIWGKSVCLESRAINYMVPYHQKGEHMNLETITLLPLTPSDKLGKCALSISTTLGSVNLKVMFPRGGTFPPGHTRVLLNLKVQLPLSHFGLLVQETSRQGEESPSSRGKCIWLLGGSRAALARWSQGRIHRAPKWSTGHIFGLLCPI